MALGTWDPDAEQAAGSITIDPQQLQRFINWSSDDRLDQLSTLLAGDERQALSGLMHLEASHWEHVAHSHSDTDLLQLVRFFAVAENLPGWEAGATSPVIPLAKALRKRGQKLDKDLLLWIRKQNKNRYLPYGPL